MGHACIKSYTALYAVCVSVTSEICPIVTNIIDIIYSVFVFAEDDEADVKQPQHAPKPPSEIPPPQRKRRRNHRIDSQRAVPVTNTTSPSRGATEEVSPVLKTEARTSGKTPEGLPVTISSPGERTSNVTSEEQRLRIRLQAAGMRIIASNGGNNKAISATTCRIL